MKITLVSGRAHQKHTEGGDFRQATYRAVRQGLRKAKSVLLEPYYEFEMELHPEHVGRAMMDIQKRNGTFEPPVADGKISILKGCAPVSQMRGYQTELTSYTGGKGRMSCRLKGYEKCPDQESMVEEIGYDPEADLENPTGSVFCAHGVDIQKRNGTFEPPVADGKISILKGCAPVSQMRGYQTELTSYTGGKGRMSCRLKGYEKCPDQESMVEEIGYDPEADLENPTGSVFCAHGAGKSDRLGVLRAWSRICSELG